MHEAWGLARAAASNPGTAQAAEGGKEARARPALNRTFGPEPRRRPHAHTALGCLARGGEEGRWREKPEARAQRGPRGTSAGRSIRGRLYGRRVLRCLLSRGQGPGPGTTKSESDGARSNRAARGGAGDTQPPAHAVTAAAAAAHPRRWPGRVWRWGRGGRCGAGAPGGPGRQVQRGGLGSPAASRSLRDPFPAPRSGPGPPRASAEPPAASVSPPTLIKAPLGAAPCGAGGAGLGLRSPVALPPLLSPSGSFLGGVGQRSEQCLGPPLIPTARVLRK